MKRALVIISALCLMAGAAKADLLAEYLFDADYSDTSGNGYDGIPGGGAIVVGGVLLLSGGAYMDLPASFGTVNPFDGSGDFTIEMDFMSNTDGILISSARDDTPDNHAMAVFLHTGWSEVDYDNFWVGAAWAGRDGLLDGEWHSLRVAYDHDHLMTEGWIELPASEWNCEWEAIEAWCEDDILWVGGIGPLAEPEAGPLIEVTILDGQDWTETGDFNPNIPDIHLDTVSLGRSLNAVYPYEILSDPAEWAIALDNVRIYSHYIPEPATMMLLGLGGLALIRRRRS
jgi:hypothetical protein